MSNRSTKILCEVKQPSSVQEDLTYLANRIRKNRVNYQPDKYLSGYDSKDIKNAYDILRCLLYEVSLDKTINSSDDFIVGRINLDEELYNIRRSIRNISGVDI